MCCSSFRGPRSGVGLRVSGIRQPMTYIAYLDEFGHIGYFASRTDPKYYHNPVFGLAGFVMPLREVRGFGTWLFQRKCDLFSHEIEHSKKHPSLWEKKGVDLYTIASIHKYPELRRFTNRFFNKIEMLGGFVFYVGVRKTSTLDQHNPNRLYTAILREAIKRLDSFCDADCEPAENFLMVLDDNSHRSKLITEAAQSMYGTIEPRRRLLELPFCAESHHHQTLQAADWIAGLVGRLGSIWVDQIAYQENEVFRRYFEQRLRHVSRRSGIRNKP